MADIGAFHCHKAELIIIITIKSSFKTGTGSRLYESFFQVLTSVGNLPTSRILPLKSLISKGLRLIPRWLIRHTIEINSNKQCDLDPIPTSLLKECADLLVPTITNIINLSLSTNTFPMQFKESVVKPLLKKPSLDKELLSNYRPV